MNETETVKACPHGHCSLRRNTGAAFGGHEPESEYYCKTCARKDKGVYRNPHYERNDLIEKKRRVNEQLEYDVSLGYVWSPSHDGE